MPRISVIVPVYNVQRHLRECLDSLRAQKYEDWEAVCVDDGSSDGSENILDEYASIDKRIKVIHQANAGVHVARNRALDVVSGEWLTYIDSDDVISTSWFSEAMRLAESSQADIVRLNYVFAQQLPSGFLCRQGGVVFHVYHDADALAFGWRMFFPKGFLWTTFIRRSLVGDLRFRPDIRCKEDGLWLIELLPRVSSICNGEFVGYFYRKTVNSLSRGKRTYTQCVAYLSALAEIWESQKELALKFGLQEILKSCICGSAENDVIEWRRMCAHNELGYSKQIRKAYLKLETIGALPKYSPTKTRYKVALWWWRYTGQTWGLAFVDGVLGMIRSCLGNGNHK